MVATQRSSRVSESPRLVKTTATRVRAVDFIVNGIPSAVDGLSSLVKALAMVLGAVGTFVVVLTKVVNASSARVEAFHLNGG